MGAFNFSNFQLMSVPFVDDMGIKYRTVEHAYQAAKTMSKSARQSIAKAPTAGIAKSKGRRVSLRTDWEQVRILAMARPLIHKFTQCPEHANELVWCASIIVENNTWHDNYWGHCVCKQCESKCHSLNMLGILLMAIRYRIATYGTHQTKRVRRGWALKAYRTGF